MKKYKSVALTLLVMLLWCSLFPMVKLGYTAYSISGVGSVLLFAGVRFTVCGVIICLYNHVRHPEAFRGISSALPAILASGLFAIILHYACTYTGLSMTDSGKTAIMKQIGALLYVCFSFLFFKEDRLTKSKLAGALIGFCGILAINCGEGGFSFGIGEFLILAASFCTVFSNVIGKRALARVSAVTMTGISQLFGGIVLLAAGLIMGGELRFAMEKWYVFAYICAASVVSYCLWYGAVQKGDLSKLFIIKFSEPVFACVFGAILLGEEIFRLRYLVAFVLISLGIVISSREIKDRAKT